MDIFNDNHELIQVDRFGDVAVGVQIVAFKDVLFITGSGQHHHWNPSEVFIMLDFFQHFTPVFSGEVQIEQNNIRAGRILIRWLAAQESQRFYPIVNDIQGIVEFHVSKRFNREADVAGIIFDQQYFYHRKNLRHLLWSPEHKNQMILTQEL